LGEEAVHLGGRFEVALAVGKEAVAGFVDGAGVADADQDVLELAAGGVVVVDVVGGEQGDVEGLGEAGEGGEGGWVVGAVEGGGGEGEARAEGFAEEGVGGFVEAEGRTRTTDVSPVLVVVGVERCEFFNSKRRAHGRDARDTGCAVLGHGGEEALVVFQEVF
jgi:hypothetical protein